MFIPGAGAPSSSHYHSHRFARFDPHKRGGDGVDSTGFTFFGGSVPLSSPVSVYQEQHWRQSVLEVSPRGHVEGRGQAGSCTLSGFDLTVSLWFCDVQGRMCGRVNGWLVFDFRLFPIFEGMKVSQTF